MICLRKHNKSPHNPVISFLDIVSAPKLFSLMSRFSICTLEARPSIRGLHHQNVSTVFGWRVLRQSWRQKRSRPASPKGAKQDRAISNGRLRVSGALQCQSRKLKLYTNHSHQLNVFCILRVSVEIHNWNKPETFL